VSLYPLHPQSAKFSIVCAFETRLAIELPIRLRFLTTCGGVALSDCKVAILASLRGTHFYGRITEKGASYCEKLLINATICDGLQQPAFCCNTRSTKAFWLKTQAAIPQTTEPKGLMKGSRDLAVSQSVRLKKYKIFCSRNPFAPSEWLSLANTRLSHRPVRSKPPRGDLSWSEKSVRVR